MLQSPASPSQPGADGPDRPVRLRVLLVEDHPAVRQGLRLMLEDEGIQVCAEADHGDEALLGAAREAPDLAVIDLALGDEDGLELLARFGRERPGLTLLVYSMFEDAEHVGQALAAGALGYVTKREAADVLAQAIRECTAGRRYLSPRVGSERAQGGAPAGLLGTLSLQERQVYQLLGQGFSTSAIAARMDLSPRTVESYFARIQGKLELEGMHALRRHAYALRA
jgi:DNA-binding NarL/FixJ family response regulator